MMDAVNTLDSRSTVAEGQVCVLVVTWPVKQQNSMKLTLLELCFHLFLRLLWLSGGFAELHAFQLQSSQLLFVKMQAASVSPGLSLPSV
jgi:hypothetical protein